MRTSKDGQHTYNIYGQDGVLRYRFSTAGVESDYHYVGGQLVARRDAKRGFNPEPWVQPATGALSMEAESALAINGSENPEWHTLVHSDASGSSAMQVRGSAFFGNANSTEFAKSPKLQWSVTAVTSGVHKLWVRARTIDGGSDSIHLALDDQPQRTYWFGAADYGKWVWKSLPLTLAAGETHRVQLWAREMNVSVDKVVLTSSSTSAPTGDGPTETAHAGDQTTTTSTGALTPGSTGGSGTTDNSSGTSTSGHNNGTTGTATNTTGASAPYTLNSGAFSLEAESGTHTAAGSDQWTRVDDSAASGAVAMQSTGWHGAGEGPRLQWQLSANTAAEFELWVRGKPNTSGDSEFITWDNGAAIQHNWYSSHYDRWVWHKVPGIFKISAGGTHTLSLWAREHRMVVDKIALLAKGSSAPTGTGPALSTQQTDGSNGGSTTSSSSSGLTPEQDVFQQNAEGVVSLEAEYAERTVVGAAQWTFTEDEDASGKESMQKTGGGWFNSAGTGPSLSWRVKAARSGKHTLWLRARPNSAGDSLHSEWDSSVLTHHWPNTYYGTWRWFQARTVTLQAGGEHTLTLWARENSMEVDKVALLPESMADPTGLGPNESLLVGEQPSTGTTNSGQSNSNTGPFVLSNQALSLEAEHATATAVGSSVWRLKDDSEASGQQSMQKSGGGWYGAGSGPSLRWDIQAGDGGEYDVWVRGKPNATGDSLWIDWDSGTAINHYWYASHYGQWVWHKPFNQPVTVAAGGQHTLTLWAREDRMDVDKVMLLPVGSAAPSGEGPVESARVPSTGALSPPNFLGGRPLRPLKATCRAVWCDFVSETFTDARGWTCHTQFSKDPTHKPYTCDEPAVQPEPEASDGQEYYVFFHTDALGSPVAMFNAKGEICWVESYAPYGEKLDNEDKAAEPATGCGLLGTDVGYTGHVQDGSGLVYAQQRYYDPVVGRFMSTDPVLPSAGDPRYFGRYQYAANSPYRYVDPDGEFFFLAFAAFSAGFTIYDTYQTYQSEGAAAAGKTLVRDAAISAVTGGAGKLAYRGYKALRKGGGVAKATKGAKRGPKTDPNAPHNKKIREIGDQIEADGGTVIAGGGRLPEQLAVRSKSQHSASRAKAV